ncbi:MAG: hypothetical protein ACRENG_37570 [bacterium]
MTIILTAGDAPPPGGAEIRPWIMREIERLQLALASEDLGMSLADGGVPVEDLSQGYPERLGHGVWRYVFGVVRGVVGTFVKAT